MTHPPFIRLGPDQPETPLVVAVPHAGRFYPPDIERERAIGMTVIEQLEDRHADRLIGRVVADGAVAIVATHGRAWIDLNRGEADGADATAAGASARAKAGLGLVPTRLGGRPLWREEPTTAEIRLRLETIHRPYHAAIADALAQARARHGVALLVDCHSMPPLGRPGRPGAGIVVGDLHGAGAAGSVTGAAITTARKGGLIVARNAPYAGAYTLATHGRPEEGIHAIQVEVDRTLYLDRALREPGAGLADVAGLFARMCWAGVAALIQPAGLAAE